MPRVSCACHCIAEQIREGDAVESCPICGGVRLARPQSTARVGEVVVVPVDISQADFDAIGRQGPGLLIVPPALEACARQITAPERCPVCQGRYPNEAAEGAFREDVAAEALEDARDDLAEALGRVVDEHNGLDSFEDLLVEVRELREAHNACLDRDPQARAEALAAAREEGRRQGLRDAAEYVQRVADRVACDVVDPPLHADKARRGWGHRLAMATFLASELNSYAKAAK